MADYLTSAAISDIASKDTNRIVGSIAKTLAVNSPFLNILEGGTFDAASDTVRSVTQEQSMPGDSLAEPTFSSDLAACNLDGSAEGVATLEFSYALESKRGRGPKVCVKQGRAAFKESYLRAEDSLAKGITQYVNADIRAQLLKRSGSKFVCASDSSFSELFTGGEGNISVAFAAGVTPDSTLNFKSLHYLARFMADGMQAEKFQSGKFGPHFKFIGSSDQVEAFRNEVGVENKLLALTQGSYKLGETAISGFSFEESPAYRGISFGVDQRPLRASAISGAGVPTLVNPVVGVATTKGTAARTNPAWLAAPFEIGFLIAPNAFKRLTPKAYTGEGSFKFSPQLHMGELEWHYQKDNDVNEWGDFGYHKYQITRAYQPIRPWFVIPIIYSRSTADLGFEGTATS